MRIALAQILSGTDPAANLQLVREYTARAADAGAALVVFPEATMCRFGVPLGPIAEPVDGPWADGVRRIAADAGVTVIAGMFTPSGDGRVTNTVIAAGPGSPNQPDAHYDKIHLYDAFGFTESRTVAPGREPVVITVDGVGVGLTVCYDIRFPALYTELARRGAQLIAVCASWGSGPGKLEQWTLLARARALDSMSYVAAAGQADPGAALAGPGSDSGAPTGVGGSLVASPLGEVVAIGRRPAAIGGRRHRPRQGRRGSREHRGAAQPVRLCSCRYGRIGRVTNPPGPPNEGPPTWAAPGNQGPFGEPPTTARPTEQFGTGGPGQSAPTTPIEPHERTEQFGAAAPPRSSRPNPRLRRGPRARRNGCPLRATSRHRRTSASDGPSATRCPSC